MDAIPNTTPIPASSHGSVRDDLLGRMRGASGPYLAGVAVCGMIVAWALFAWGYQILNGFGNTGIRRPVYWGFYIVNFVFWIGITQAAVALTVGLIQAGVVGWGIRYMIRMGERREQHHAERHEETMAALRQQGDALRQQGDALRTLIERTAPSRA